MKTNLMGKKEFNWQSKTIIPVKRKKSSSHRRFFVGTSIDKLMQHKSTDKTSTATLYILRMDPILEIKFHQ